MSVENTVEPQPYRLATITVENLLLPNGQRDVHVSWEQEGNDLPTLLGMIEMARENILRVEMHKEKD